MVMRPVCQALGWTAALASVSACTSPPARSVASAEKSSENTGRVVLSQAAVVGAEAPDSDPAEVHSLLNVREPIRYGKFVWNEEGVPSGDVWIRVDLESQIISVFRAGHEIGTAAILYGANEKPTPVGTFSILDKRKVHRSNLYDADMPYTLRLTNDGIAIHGSDVRRNSATHGCIGVPLQFASRLFEQTKIGDQVVVVQGG